MPRKVMLHRDLDVDIFVCGGGIILHTTLFICNMKYVFIWVSPKADTKTMIGVQVLGSQLKEWESRTAMEESDQRVIEQDTTAGNGGIPPRTVEDTSPKSPTKGQRNCSIPIIYQLGVTLTPWHLQHFWPLSLWKRSTARECPWRPESCST